ncbi:S-methyl-5-thioribose kinase [Gayadomonas joobiniege]|uniref:S-methyl-5-thioribose kinase n=1 Tax=Gayadomonas joobiniege TaxID=1234606 RepID=UPI00035C4654|nr:S-methyl-5-thioribose kinase [Gayadomonas joobiniege]
MTEDKFFTEASAIDYARTELNYFASDAQLSAKPLGDGVLNRVFKVVDENTKRSLIVKQYLPKKDYLGTPWPLTVERAEIATKVLRAHAFACPQYTVELLHADSKLGVLVLEDLSDHLTWRQILMQRKQVPFAGEHLGVYLARAAFFNSDYYVPSMQKKAQVAETMNAQMLQITENLVFSDPYNRHERNKYNLLMANEADLIQSDQDLHIRVAQLKYKFLNQNQTLLHGNLHSDNILVTETGTKVINGEFGCYGPISFDVGTLLAHLLLNYVAQPGLTDKNVAEVYQIYLRDQISLLWNTFTSEFARLMAAETRDKGFRLAAYQNQALQQINQDAIGYAGTEMIRRVVGYEHVPELDTIAQSQQRAGCEYHALLIGKTMIMQAEDLTSADDIMALLKRIIQQER